MTQPEADLPIRLDADFLLEEAKRRTGLSDYGDPWFLEPFGVLVRSMREEAALNELGVQYHGGKLLNSLTNRLIIRDFINRHPEVKEMPVRVAAVIAGLPRTGSTLLHRLLSQPRDATSVLWWETFAPVPYQGEEIGHPEQRIAAAQEIVRQMREAVPDMDSIHPLYAEEPDEELMLLEQSFIGWAAEAAMNVPGYVEWLKAADLTPAYQELRELLQLLTFQDRNRKDRQWVLKAPYHVTALPVLMKVFPGVRIVMTHRDPLKTVASFASMCSMLTEPYTSVHDPKRVGQHWQSQLSRGLSLFLDGREQFGEDRFVDVFYEDQIKDPVGTAVRVLKEIGLRAEDEDVALIRKWMDRFPRDSRPSHKYTLEEFGLSEDGIKAAFADYRARFITRGN